MSDGDGYRASPDWAKKHIENLAKIYDRFALGQAGIAKFINDEKLKAPDYGYEKFIDTFPSAAHEQFHEMLQDEPIKTFRSSLEKLNELPTSILKSINRDRGIRSQFPTEIRSITTLEGSLPEALFSVRGEGFPLSPKELQERATRCRRIYNIVRHIADRRSDTPEKYKQTYNKFFKFIPNLSLKDITQLYVDMLKVI